MGSKDEFKRKFLSLPEEKQKELYDNLTALFTKLEADWRANPENEGKPISYVKLWEEFISAKDSDVKPDLSNI